MRILIRVEADSLLGIALALLRKGTLAIAAMVERRIEQIVLLDGRPRSAIADRALNMWSAICWMWPKLVGLLASDIDTILHLALWSAASGGGSRARLSINLERNRSCSMRRPQRVRRPKFLFASSGAVFAGRCHPLTDATLPAPESSYGTQKLCCEHL